MKKIKQTKTNILCVILGRLFIYATLYVGSVAFGIWAFMQVTTCR